MEEINLKDIADDLLILNKLTIDKLFQLDNAADCIALYMLYYKTAKWQKTNQPKATDEYIRKCLKWGLAKIRKTKKTLQENGLIEIIQARKDGKISGWYIKVAYLISETKLENVKIKTINLDNKEVEQEVLNATNREEKTNALKENNKYLKKENINNINIINMEKTEFSKNNILEKPKKQLTEKQKQAIERTKILEEFIKDEDEDIKKALRDYVDIRKKKGLQPKQLQLILEKFEKAYCDKPKHIILEQIERATARGWMDLSYEDNFKGTIKSSYNSKPSFDNTTNHDIKVIHLSDEEFDKLSFEEKKIKLNEFDAIADMTPKQKEFYKENCLARDKNGNLLKF